MYAIILYHVGYVHVWVGPLVTTEIVLIGHDWDILYGIPCKHWASGAPVNFTGNTASPANIGHLVPQ